MLGPYYVGDNPAAALVIDVTRNDTAVDLSGYDTATLTVTGPDGETVTWDAEPVVGASSITVPFPTSSPFTTAGVYTLALVLVATPTGATERVDPVGLTVLAVGASTTWATVAEVEATTGVAVGKTDLLQAQAVIDVYANRTVDAADGLTARDRGWLKRALCWQAAWQAQQYGYAGRQNATSVGQDGLSVSRGAEHHLTLAPLAARALRNLSWKGTRTTRVERVEFPRGSGVLTDFENEAADVEHGWEPMD